MLCSRPVEDQHWHNVTSTLPEEGKEEVRYLVCREALAS